MDANTILSYLIGFIIGFLLNIWLLGKPVHHIKQIKPFQPVNTTNDVSMTLYQVQNNEATVEDVKKIRILCFLNTRPASHGERASHILELWGKHCDKILFASTLTDVNIGAIGFNLSDNHESMWGKEKLMLKYIHQNYIDDYDWFLKGDDDMFLLAENIRFLLYAYSPNDPIYFGHKFNTTEHKWGYFSGGSGYVMSHQTVRIFVEKVLTNPKFFHKDNPYEGGCHIETDDETEYWHISVCLDYYNVYAGDARDLVKRDRFFPFWPEMHLFGSPDPNNWYWQRKYYFNDEGLDCCSNYTIAFHYIGAKYQYTMYYLIYRLQPFGILRRFPPPPLKKNFEDVKRLLDEERTNKTLRGY